MPSQNDYEWPGDVSMFHAPDGAHEYTVRAPESLRSALYVYGAGNDTPYTFQMLRHAISDQLKKAPRIHRGTWQTMNVAGSDLHITRELINYNLFYTVPELWDQLVDEVQPDMPWAAEHFAERVGGQPLNPPPSHVNWPYHGSDKARHLEDGVKFSHTYPERFWPKYASNAMGRLFGTPNQGIRFEYGDLDGVIEQLTLNPYTRQAVLPIWFPEDTGATDRRVPCTLAYHFMCDSDMRLHMWYYLRACDFIRHFHNDVFFAAALLQWVCARVTHPENIHNLIFKPGNLNMTISSLHVFEGDLARLP